MELIPKIFLVLFAIIFFSATINPAFAVHNGEGNHPTPQPITDNYDPLSLKSQIFFNTPLNETSCKNNNHILSERNNGKLACVTPYAMVKMQLNPVDDSFWSDVMRNDQGYIIFAHLSKTQNVESVKYEQDANSVIVHMISDNPEKLSVKVDKEIIEYPSEECPGNVEYPDWAKYMVLINGEEVDYDERINHEKYRYLEIQIDLPNPLYAEDILRHTKEVHVMHDVPYQPDSKIIEIIGTCVI